MLVENILQAKRRTGDLHNRQYNGLAPLCFPTPPCHPTSTRGSCWTRIERRKFRFLTRKGGKMGYWSLRWEGLVCKMKRKAISPCTTPVFFFLVVKDRCSTPSLPTRSPTLYYPSRHSLALLVCSPIGTDMLKRRWGAKWRMGQWIPKKGH